MRETLKKRIQKLDSQIRPQDSRKMPPELEAKMQEAWERGDIKEWSRLLWSWLDATMPKEMIQRVERNLEIIYGRGANND